MLTYADVSVGDLVANLAMAKAGMPAMAAGACLGAPTLNLLLGGGLSTLLGLMPYA
jgi:Ca2+/Na+ antiporter